jgi:2-aminomuconate deaminase
MSQMPLESQTAPEPVGAYPHARRVGNMLYLSGVGPRQRGSKAIPGVSLGPQGEILSYDIALQCHSVFANVRAILAEAGAQWEDLVDITVYLTHMQADFQTFNQIWATYFPNPATRPCRTTIEVGALPTPIAIELKCLAELKPSQGEINAAYTA